MKSCSNTTSGLRTLLRCPLCASDDNQPLVHVETEFVSPVDRPLTYQHCHCCGLVYSNHVLSSAATNKSSMKEFGYKEFLAYTQHKLRINAYRKMWLDKTAEGLHWKPTGRKALDIGTKDGSFIKLLKADGWAAIGIDPNSSKLAWDINGAEIQRGVLKRDTYAPRSFDLVSCFHVIEHLSDPLAFMSSVRSALMPEGLFYIETPNLAHIQQRQLNRGHVILYSRSTLLQLLEQCGFKILMVSEYGPGGIMTFDQLTVLARPACDTEAGPSAWVCKMTIEEARSYLQQALESDFPYPSEALPSRRLFRLAQKVLGNSWANSAKEVYRLIQRKLRGATLTRSLPAGHSPLVSGMSDPIRAAMDAGTLDKKHLDELLRLPDDFAQLKVLARIKAFRLNHEETRRLVTRELESLNMQGAV